MVPLSEAIAVHLLYLRRQRANVTATWLWFSTTMCDELFVVVPFIMIFSLRMVKHWDLKLSTWFPFIYLLWKNNITKIDSSLVSCLKHGFRLVKTGFGLQLWSMPVGLWLSAARASTSWWTIGLWRLVLEQPWENKSFRKKTTGGNQRCEWWLDILDEASWCCTWGSVVRKNKFLLGLKHIVQPCTNFPMYPNHALLLLQDFEMVRIFDSMVYEDEVTDDLSMGIVASGELDASQTRQAMCLVCT